MKQNAEDDTTHGILDNLNTAVLTLEGNLRLGYINPAGEMLFSTSARHAQAMTLPELLPEEPAFAASLRKALASGHPYTELELRLTLLGGRTITVDCTVTPLTEPGREPLLLVELLQIDRHLRVTREEHLITQQHAVRSLVRGLAHEVKNPLGGLRGAAQLLARELPDKELKEYTDIIIQEADRLQNLMDRMLGPNNLPRKRLINIHQVVERVHSLVQAEAASAIVLARDYDPSIPLLSADADMLIQALLNIVRNAVQALGESGTVTLRTRTRRQFTLGQKRHKLIVCIDVIDNGPGIAPEMIEQVFYPMVTGRAEGTGLGLSIAQSLVNQHGGLIECQSQPGCTVFSLLIPLENGILHG